MCAQEASKSKSKICFVIAPIGEVGSVDRERSDQVFRYIIKPAATACGYEPLRADQITKPGIITSQVIEHLIEDPLVIADLTGPNANVFYELAIRHGFRKPVVQIIDAEQAIPFDLAGSRTIRFRYPDLAGAERARDEIEQQIKAVEENPEEVDNPLTQAVKFQSLSQSGNPVEKSLAGIIAMLQDLKTGQNEIQQNTKRDVVLHNPRFASEDFRDLTSAQLAEASRAIKWYEAREEKPTSPPKISKDKESKSPT
jgi:hypothetical protein